MIVQLESAQGRGVSRSHGLAGLADADATRDPAPGAEPALSRATVRQIVPLSRWTIDGPRTPKALLTRLPETRLELIAGKVAATEFFDVNEVAGDAHREFINGAVLHDAAFDFASDERGVTWGGIADFESPWLSIRAGELLMPVEPRGRDLDWRVDRARAGNLELELADEIGREHGSLTLRVFIDHGRLGRYRDALDAYRSGLDPLPDTSLHRITGHPSTGFAVTASHTFRPVALFLRAGWNDGGNEAFGNTEANDSFGGGLTAEIGSWRMNLAEIGTAIVSSGLSPDHREYLEAGGVGLQLGDGALRYARETVVETFFTMRIWRGLSGGADFQEILNPGFNADRGPVTIGSLRFHADL